MPQAAAEQVLPAGRSPASIPAERLPAASGWNRVWGGAGAGGQPPRNGREIDGLGKRKQVNSFSFLDE